MALGHLFSVLLCSQLLASTFSIVNHEQWIPKTYDFIIVGGGTAGSVIASRLSEMPGITILLLEAGSELPKDAEIPFYADKFWGNPMFDWQLKMEPQKKACQGFINNECPWICSKVLGGGSSINAMVYTRGNKNDFDRWEALGNEGWSYDKVLPYFLKLEDYQVSHNKYDAPYHSSGGPVTISQPLYRTQLAEAFMEAGNEMNYFKVDYNAEEQKGFAMPVFNIRNGSRCGTYKAYLEQNRNKPNLHVVTDARVIQVLLVNNKVNGLRFIKDSKEWRVGVDKEIILSAGTTLSPYLLLLSGIGAKQILETFRVPMKADLPGVGLNLKDHIVVTGLTFTTKEPIGMNFDKISEDDKRLYEQRKMGVLSVPLGIEGISFVDTEFADPFVDYPDIELILSHSKAIDIGLTPELKDFVNRPGENAFTIYPILHRPHGKGYVTLRSGNYHKPPKIQPRYLDKDRDAKILLDAVKIIFQLVNTKAFKKFGVEYHNEKLPQCQTLADDEYWLCYIKHLAFGLFHGTGTCKMGPKSDRAAVVDSNLRVYGVKGLRVADASIMPAPITGDTNAATIMIAEKAADMIKKEWNLKRKD